MDKLETAEDLVQIFKKHNTEIYNFVYFNVNRKKEIAEDITQDIFMRAWEYRNSFKGEKGSIRNWLYTITRNRVYDYYRSDKHDVSLEENDVIQDEEALQDLAIMKEYVQEKLDLINFQDRELLILRYIHELEIEEISTLINKNYNTTKVAIHRALNKLKEKIIIKS